MFMLSSKGLPKKSVVPTRCVAVPGKLMNWLLKEGLKWKGGLKPPKKNRHKAVFFALNLLHKIL